VQSADVENTASGGVAKHPVNVYIEQVYEYGNFSQLGIGV